MDALIGILILAAFVVSGYFFRKWRNKNRNTQGGSGGTGPADETKTETNNEAY